MERGWNEWNMIYRQWIVCMPRWCADDDAHKGSHHVRKTVKKVDNVRTGGGGGGLPQFINFSLILPGPQITWKWTIHTDNLTTKWHICLHTWKQGGLMCGIWDWQSTIVKDLNDSQDPKHTLICRENAFVAIYALFSDNKCPLFTRLGGGSPKADIVHFFDRFSYMMASLGSHKLIMITIWKILLLCHRNYEWIASNLTVFSKNSIIFFCLYYIGFLFIASSWFWIYSAVMLK